MLSVAIRTTEWRHEVWHYAYVTTLIILSTICSCQFYDCSAQLVAKQKLSLPSHALDMVTSSSSSLLPYARMWQRTDTMKNLQQQQKDWIFGSFVLLKLWFELLYLSLTMYFEHYKVHWLKWNTFLWIKYKNHE